MDRSLDEVISQRRGANNQSGRRDRRRNPGPRDGIRKSTSRDSGRDIDRDWLHDKFDDDGHGRTVARGQAYKDRRQRHSPEADNPPTGAKLRIDNLHYDLTEDDLENKDLFSRIAPLLSPPSLRFDRAGRSTGVAFVTYASVSAANRAISEFNGANAAGQPIRLTLTASGPSNIARQRNPFDTAQKPSRSLFERVSGAPAYDDADADSDRSASPDRPRHSNVSKPAPEGIDRYVPGQRTRSPIRPRGGRRPGARRDESSRDREGRRERGSRDDHPQGGRQPARDGRPRKTQEELDAEMEDYWSKRDDDVEDPGTQNGSRNTGTAEVSLDADIDMIE